MEYNPHLRKLNRKYRHAERRIDQLRTELRVAYMPLINAAYAAGGVPRALQEASNIPCVLTRALEFDRIRFVLPKQRETNEQQDR